MTVTKAAATTGPDRPLPDSVQTLARCAEIAAFIGMMLFGVYLSYMLASSLNGSIDAAISEEFLDSGKTGRFSPWQRGFAALLGIVPDLFGIAALASARGLFEGYRRGEIFTLAASARLRFIGWMVVLLAPVGMLTRTIGIAVFTAWTEPGRLNIDLEIGDGEVYAIVFGMLIVVVGHVMYRAIEIDTENKAFV